MKGVKFIDILENEPDVKSGGAQCSEGDDEENDCLASHQCTRTGGSPGYCIEKAGHVNQHLCGKCGGYFD